MVIKLTHSLSVCYVTPLWYSAGSYRLVSSYTPYFLLSLKNLSLIDLLNVMAAITQSKCSISSTPRLTILRIKGYRHRGRESILIYLVSAHIIIVVAPHDRFKAPIKLNASFVNIFNARKPQLPNIMLSTANALRILDFISSP